MRQRRTPYDLLVPLSDIYVFILQRALQRSMGWKGDGQNVMDLLRDNIYVLA